MKMSDETFNILLDDVRSVIRKVEETNTKLWPNSPDLDVENLTMRNMWDILLVINMDRSSVDHPRHREPTLVPRCLEYTDRGTYWLWEQDGGLDDSHIETAFKKMISIITKEQADKVDLKASAKVNQTSLVRGAIHQLDWPSARSFDDELHYTLMSGWAAGAALELEEGSKIFDYINVAFSNGLYQKVAEVVSSDRDINDVLDSVYRDSQSLERAWFAEKTDNLHPISSGPYRSTSVGDVIEVDGEYFFTAPVGFKKLTNFEPKLDNLAPAPPTVSP